MLAGMSGFITTAKFVQNITSSFFAKRGFGISLKRPLKEIQIAQEKNAIVIKGVNVAAPKEDYLLQQACSARFCPECTLGLEIKHTDVLILSQYLRSDGCMLPRRITGLCRRQHRRIGTMVAMAQKAGLMPNLAPANSKRDPKKRFQWKKFNKYFDENKIKW